MAGQVKCKHPYWDIDEHNVGTCRDCGEVRRFPWEDGGQIVVLTEGKLVSSFSSAYTPEQRLEIVEEARLKGIKVVAAEKGIPPTTISTWKRRLEKQAKKIGGLPWRTLMVQHLEVEKGRLNKEIQRIEAERESLSIKIDEHQETIDAIDRVLKMERENKSPRDIKAAQPDLPK
jgi:transposase-like protein